MKSFTKTFIDYGGEVSFCKASIRTSSSEKETVADLELLSVKDFTKRFRNNSSHCLKEVYKNKQPIDESLISGALTIPLPQDVFLLVETQLNLLDDYLLKMQSSSSTTSIKQPSTAGQQQQQQVIIDCLLSILRNISYKQSLYKQNFLQEDLTSCVAAANSFLWMVDKVDNLISSFEERYTNLVWSTQDPLTSLILQEAQDLISQLGNDAVMAISQSAVDFIMKDIRESGLPDRLFGLQWEEQQNNELAVSMTRILERDISSCQGWLEQDFLFHKLVTSLARAMVSLYIQCVIEKAEKLRRSKSTMGKVEKKITKNQIAFNDPKIATTRIVSDIQVIQDYFQDIAEENVALNRALSTELSALSLLSDCVTTAAAANLRDIQDGHVEELIMTVHERAGADCLVTKFFMSDIFRLVGEKEGRIAVEKRIAVNCATAQISLLGRDSTLDQLLKKVYKDRIKSENSVLTSSKEVLKRNSEKLKKEMKDLVEVELGRSRLLSERSPEFVMVHKAVTSDSDSNDDIENSARIQTIKVGDRDELSEHQEKPLQRKILQKTERIAKGTLRELQPLPDVINIFELAAFDDLLDFI